MIDYYNIGRLTAMAYAAYAAVIILLPNLVYIIIIIDNKNNNINLLDYFFGVILWWIISYSRKILWRSIGFILIILELII